jgi:hypothetical protein
MGCVRQLVQVKHVAALDLCVSLSGKARQRILGARIGEKTPPIAHPLRSAPTPRAQ